MAAVDRRFFRAADNSRKYSGEIPSQPQKTSLFDDFIDKITAKNSRRYQRKNSEEQRQEQPIATIVEIS